MTSPTPNYLDYVLSEGYDPNDISSPDFLKNQQNLGFNSGLAGSSSNSFWGDTFKSFDNLLPAVGGLASLYMQWDKLQAEKAKARDAHNATRTQYNNEMTRAKNLGKSIHGDDYEHTQANIAKSTV